MDEFDTSAETTLDASRLSRRTMIKVAAGAGAALWAAPAVTSVGASAYAAGSPTCNANNAFYNCNYDPSQNCGASGPFNLCVCAKDTEGRVACLEDGVCGRDTCNTTTDCPAGWHCIPSCCGSVCFPPCGTNAFSSQDKSQLKSATQR